MRAAAIASIAMFVTELSAAANLTDLSLFSSNAEGNNWNGLVWNTQGADTDIPDRFNLYVTTDPLADLSPQFINRDNDANARIAIALAPGVQTYVIYGEGVDTTFDPLQHFVLNLYFDGGQSVPLISGVQNLANTNLQPAGHPNGLDIYGNAGTPEAGALAANVGNVLVTLQAFTWNTDGNRDIVWPNWANDPPYSAGSGHLDYFGSFTLDVRQQVPLPATSILFGLGAVALAWCRRRGGSARA